MLARTSTMHANPANAQQQGMPHNITFHNHGTESVTQAKLCKHQRPQPDLHTPRPRASMPALLLPLLRWRKVTHRTSIGSFFSVKTCMLLKGLLCSRNGLSRFSESQLPPPLSDLIFTPLRSQDRFRAEDHGCNRQRKSLGT